MEYGRLLKVKNLSQNVVAIVRFKGSSEGVYANISYIEKDFKEFDFYFSDGENYFKITFSGEFFPKADLTSGVSVGVVNGGKIVGFGSVGKIEFSKEGFCDFEKNVQQEEERKTQNFVYDDFKIAEENYFEKEILNGKQNPCNEETESSGAENFKNGQATLFVFNDEKNDCDGKKSGYKPENTDKKQFFGDKILNETTKRGEDVHPFKKLTSGKSRRRDFDDLLLNSEFYLMEKGERFYLFGAILKDDHPVTYVYAVPAKKDNPPIGFEKGYFIPKSFFNTEEGFYCLFKDVAL